MTAWQITGVLERSGFRVDTMERACPSGMLGRIFGHRWLTVQQIEVPPDGRPPFRVYLAQRCRSCHQENARFNRVYLPPIRDSLKDTHNE